MAAKPGMRQETGKYYKRSETVNTKLER